MPTKNARFVVRLQIIINNQLTLESDVTFSPTSTTSPAISEPVERTFYFYFNNLKFLFIFLNNVLLKMVQTTHKFTTFEVSFQRRISCLGIKC